jgi:hypothetical protein
VKCGFAFDVISAAEECVKPSLKSSDVKKLHEIIIGIKRVL